MIQVILFTIIRIVIHVHKLRLINTQFFQVCKIDVQEQKLMMMEPNDAEAH